MLSRISSRKFMCVHCVVLLAARLRKCWPLYVMFRVACYSGATVAAFAVRSSCIASTEVEYARRTFRMAGGTWAMCRQFTMRRRFGVCWIDDDDDDNVGDALFM